MSIVAVDMGASGTRYTSDGRTIMEIPNNYVVVELDKKLDLPKVNESFESSLDVTIKILDDKEKEESNKIFPVRILMGDMALRHTEPNKTPHAMAAKTSQPINYYSALIATALDALYINKDSKESYLAVDLYLALPPLEVRTEGLKEKVSNDICGNYKIIFNSLGKTVTLHIETVKCYEESYLALLSYLFSIDGKLTDQGKECSKVNVLSMNIGASTTDVSIFKDMIYQEKSGQTFKIGGNIAIAKLTTLVGQKFEYEMEKESAEIAIKEGRIKIGTKYEDIADLVIIAKKECAKSVVEKLMPYFLNVGIALQTISYIVVSGGGSLESKYIDENGEEIITSAPMSDYITEEINRICKTVEVVYYGRILKDVNPRYADVIGLYIRAYMESLRNKINKSK